MVRIALSLIIGVLLTIGVAYFVAIRDAQGALVVATYEFHELPPASRKYFDCEDSVFVCAGISTFGRRSSNLYEIATSYTDFIGHQVSRDVHSDAKSLEEAFLNLSQGVEQLDAPPVPSAQRLTPHEILRLAGPTRIGRLEVGWPMPAFEGHVTRELYGGGCSGPWIKSETRVNIRDAGQLFAQQDIIDGIPYAPIPAGLLTNITFYSSVSWLVLLALSFSRGNWRVRNSRCAKCAYDMRASTTGICPECGTQVSDETAFTTQTSADPDPS